MRPGRARPSAFGCDIGDNLSMVHRSRHERICWAALGFIPLGLLIWGAYRFVGHPEEVGGLGTPLLLSLMWWWIAQAGPARGRSLRARADRAKAETNPLRDRSHPNFWIFWPSMAIFASAIALSAIDERLGRFALAVTYVYLIGFMVRVIASERHQRKALGFHPDFYVAVQRRVGEPDRRPELLVHHPSKQPEYSGWYAFASERDQCSDDLVVWSMQDLVDYAPEAARPLREGRGQWRWDQAQRAYAPVQAFD